MADSIRHILLQIKYSQFHSLSSTVCMHDYLPAGQTLRVWVCALWYEFLAHRVGIHSGQGNWPGETESGRKVGG